MVKRKAAAAAWVILCFGFFMVFRTKGMEPVGILFPGAILLYTVSGCLAVCAGGRSSRFQQTLPGSDRALFFILWGILLLAWLPAYLALFPGTFGYDVPDDGCRQHCLFSSVSKAERDSSVSFAGRTGGMRVESDSSDFKL